ncbi:MAG: hypothetical protein MHPSP_002899, partial [Paramarteilia canceri]
TSQNLVLSIFLILSSTDLRISAECTGEAGSNCTCSAPKKDSDSSLTCSCDSDKGLKLDDSQKDCECDINKGYISNAANYTCTCNESKNFNPIPVNNNENNSEGQKCTCNTENNYHETPQAIKESTNGELKCVCEKGYYEDSNSCKACEFFYTTKAEGSVKKDDCSEWSSGFYAITICGSIFVLLLIVIVIAMVC